MGKGAVLAVVHQEHEQPVLQHQLGLGAALGSSDRVGGDRFAGQDRLFHLLKHRGFDPHQPSKLLGRHPPQLLPFHVDTSATLSYYERGLLDEPTSATEPTTASRGCVMYVFA